MEQEEDLMDDLQPVNKFLPCILDDREAVVIQKLTDMQVKDSIDRITFKIIFGDGDQAEPIMEVWKTPALKSGIEIYHRSGIYNDVPLSFNPMLPQFGDEQRTQEQIEALGMGLKKYIWV